MAELQTRSERLEEYINNVLKEDLKLLEQHIMHYNDEIMEFVQLKNTIQAICDNLPEEGFKTQMNIGSNIFMEAQVEQPSTILVDIGKGYYMEFTLEEALKFADLKIRVLTKESEVLREESIKKRGNIKLALMAMGEQEKLHAETNKWDREK